MLSSNQDRPRPGDGPADPDPDRTVPGGLLPAGAAVGLSAAPTEGPHCTVKNEESAAPVVPGYEILNELGRGGMGVVYKARQAGLNRLVALKIILGGAHASTEDVARFLAEAETVAQLRHPNIVQIHQVVQQAGLPFFSLEYIDGGALSQRLAGVPQPPADAARLVESLARAMHHAHQQGILHRDLKPGNVLLALPSPSEEPSLSSASEANAPLSACTPKIADFGLAKRVEGGHELTRTGTILGTPSYMAPEQALGGKVVGPAADVYALGAILYEMLTGRPPFRAPTPLDTVLQVLSSEPVSPKRLQPGVPRDLETICLKCLRKDATRRYAGAGALADDLNRFLGDRPILARRTGSLERTWRWCRRNPAVALLCAVVSALLLSLTIVSVIAAIRIDAARREANRKADDEKAAREKADEAAAAEKLARHRAQERLVRLNIVTGNFLTDAGDHGGALLRYAQAWLLDRDEPGNEPMHRRRLACLLERYPRLEGICFHPAGVLEAHLDARTGRLLSRTEDGRAFLQDMGRSQPILRPLRSSATPDALEDSGIKVLLRHSGALPHEGKVLGAALAPDGALAATAGADGTARLWDTATGRSRGAAASPASRPSRRFQPGRAAPGDRLRRRDGSFLERSRGAVIAAGRAPRRRIPIRCLQPRWPARGRGQ